MNCGQAQEAWIDRMFGELNADAERSLSAHLAECAACRAGQAGMEAVLGLSRSLRVDTDIAPRVSAGLPETTGDSSDPIFELSAALRVTPSTGFADRVAAAVAATGQNDESDAPAGLEEILALAARLSVSPSPGFAERVARALDAAESVEPLRRELILDYALKNMSYEDRLILENTTLRDEAAFAEFTSLQNTLDALRSIPSVQPSPGFAARIAAEVETLSDQIIDVSCDFTRAHLVDYIFNEVTELQDIAINMHIKDCYLCKEERDSLQLTVESARLGGSVAPHSGFSAEVQKKIQAYLEREREYRRIEAGRSLPERAARATLSQIRRMPLVAASAVLHAAMIFIMLMSPGAPRATLHQMADKLPAQPSTRAFTAAIAREDAPSRDAVPSEILETMSLKFESGDRPNEPRPGFGDEDENAIASAGLKQFHDGDIYGPVLAGDYFADAGAQDRALIDLGVAIAPDERLSASGSLFADRIDAARRRKVLSQYNSVETDGFLRSGINFLQRAQLNDGSWPVGNETYGGSAAHRVGISALAMLTFTGHGHCAADGTSYGDTLQQGVLYLLDQQDKDGYFGSALNENHYMYSHALATLAMLENVILAGDRGVMNDAAAAGVRAILAAQLKNGAWGYTKDLMREMGDSSITIWQMQALATARQAELGIPVKTIDAALRSALIYVHSLRNDKGLTAYDEYGRFQYGERAMTAADLFIRGLAAPALGKQDKGLVDPAIDAMQAAFLAKNVPAVVDVDYVQPEKARDEANDFYYWYYASHAMLRAGRDAYEEWNQGMIMALYRLQTKTGDMAGAFEGRHGKFGRAGGTIYTTSMALLTLESYYRYPAK